MGYRVGGQCFGTEQEASDYKMSLVVPVIAADGTLKMPVRQADGWYYGIAGGSRPRPYPYPGSQSVTIQQKITLTHPQCDVTEYFKEGVSVGIYLTGLFAIVFFVRLVKRIVYSNDHRSDYDA